MASSSSSAGIVPPRRRTDSYDPSRTAFTSPFVTTSVSDSSSSSSPSTMPTSLSSAATATAATSTTPLNTLSMVTTSINTDEGSSTSHTSSSRLGNTTSTQSPRQVYHPLSFADALTRANHDATRALDEVLVERNKLCLEANKLGSENIRIWNLVRRFKKENEDLKATTPTSTRATTTTSNTSPLITTLTASPSDPGPEVSNSAPLLSASHLQPSRGSSLLSTPSSTARQLKGSDPTTSSALLPASISAPTSSTSFSTDSASHDIAPSTPVHLTGSFPPSSPQSGAAPSLPRELIQSPQQTSIMLQRAAAQKLATMASPRATGNGSRRNSLEDHDFEAVDGSSVANSESEEARQSLGTPLLTSKTLNEAPTTPNRSREGKKLYGTDRRYTLSSESLNMNTISSSSSLSPRLDATMLSYLNIAVIGTNLRSNDRVKDDISFYIAIELKAAPTGLKWKPISWRIEKLYTACVALDARLKQKHGKSKSTIKKIANVQLPDRTLFKDHAPSKVDQRKVMLEAYLQNLLVISMPDKDDVCTFLCTDAFREKPNDPEAVTKEGHLTKKGANLGRWVTRLYCLSGSMLDYYESRGGPQIGTINIIGAQIGRQQKSENSDMDENSYRHAFLILESKPALLPGEPKQMIRHVLCAESDEERDDWVDVLVRAIAAMVATPTTTTNNGQTASPAPSLGTALPSPPSARKLPLHMNNDVKQGSTRDGLRKASVDDAMHSPRTVTYPLRQQSGEPLQTHLSPSPASIAAIAVAGTGATVAGGASAAAVLSMSRSRSDQGRFSLDDQPSNNNSSNSRQPQLQSQQPPSQQQSPGPTYARLQQGRAKSNTIGSADIFPRTVITPSNDSSYGQSSLLLPESNSITSGLNRAQRPSISGPMNGTPIPSGYKFGGKEDANAAQDTKKRFWHRFGGATGNEKGGQPKKVFGVSLAESISVSNVSEGLELPSVVYRCIEYLEARNAVLEEGIYRLSGSSAVIKNLRERFNTQGDVNLLASTEPFYDPHAIAGLLKQFLRELTDSVLTRELHFDFLRVNELVERKERVNELGHLVSLLPLANYSLLRTLCNHLITVIEKEDINKMTMRNVGIVFSPTLGIPGGVFALFLTEFDWVFFTDARGEPAPKQMEADIIAPDNDELGIRNPTPSPKRSTALELHDSENSDMLEPLSPSPVRPLRRLSITNKRDNRNSLRYNEAEAEKLLGGAQSRFRLGTQHEELEATLDSMILTNSQFMDQMPRLIDQDTSSEHSGGLSPSMMTMPLQASPRSPSRLLPKQNLLIPDPSPNFHSNFNTPIQSGAARLRSNSHNPRMAVNPIAYNFNGTINTSEEQGH